MDELVYYAALSYNESIGPRRYDKIRLEFPDLKSFFDLKPGEMMGFLGIKNEEHIQFFKDMLPRGEKIVEICGKKNIQMIARESTLYHPRLKEIPDAPFLYYQIGQMNYSVKMIAIVGTRSVTPEAASINEYMTKELVSYNIGIVSGMAKGHDSIAQRTALSNDGFTAAVLGSGIDVVYPAEHRELYHEICRKGAVISEYPPGAASLKSHFPLRNRVISGLADAVLIIQAPEKSGALITANYAEAQGRELYAVPGNPIEPKNKGSNALIQKGARIALSPEEIVLDILGRKAKKINKIPQAEIDNLSREEKLVLEHLSGETLFDDLIGLTGLELPRLNHILTMMEMRGLVTQYPGRIYVKAVIL